MCVSESAESRGSIDSSIVSPSIPGGNGGPSGAISRWCPNPRRAWLLLGRRLRSRARSCPSAARVREVELRLLPDIDDAVLAGQALRDVVELAGDGPVRARVELGRLGAVLALAPVLHQALDEHGLVVARVDVQRRREVLRQLEQAGVGALLVVARDERELRPAEVVPLHLRRGLKLHLRG